MRGGKGRALVVVGDAGIGKSALLRHVMGAASGFQIVRAVGVESEMKLPFTGLHQICRPLLHLLDRLPVPQRDAVRQAFGLQSGAPPDPILIALAALSLVSEASHDRPLLAIVDDMQWLDRESAQVLTFVARRLLAEPVCLIMAARALSHEFTAIPQLVVERLHEEDAKALFSAMVPWPQDDRVRDRVVAETHGNPLALLEWSRRLTPIGLAEGLGMPDGPVSGWIEENFRRRIAELPPKSQRFLTLAAAEPTGDPLVLWRAASAMGLDATDYDPPADAGLLEIGIRVSFQHPLVRAAAYSAAPLAERKEAHRTLAAVIDVDIDPDRHAWHAALGTTGPDDAIADALERAAAAAMERGALAASGALLERAAVLALEPQARVRRVLQAAAAYLEAGLFEPAADVLTMADVRSLDGVTRAHVDLLLGRVAAHAGKLTEAPDLILGAARALESIDPDLAVIAHLGALTSASVASGLGRSGLLREVSEAAMQCPLPEVLTVREWLLVGLAQFNVDGPEAANPALRRALDKPERDAAGGDTAQWRLSQLAPAMMTWDLETHNALAAAHVEEARAQGALRLLPVGLNSVAAGCVLNGDLDAAEAALAEATQITEVTGSRFHFTNISAICAGLRGGEDAVEVIRDQMESSRASGFAVGLASALWAHASLRNGMGLYRDALAVAMEAMDTSWPWGEHVYIPELVEAAVRCGKHDVASVAMERLVRTTAPSGTDWAIGVQRRCEAILRPNEPEAEDRFVEAVHRLARPPVRTELARAHLLYGEWLRRSSRRVDAREQLRQAFEMFTKFGMVAFADRARREHQATGETVRTRSTDRFGELTPQESRIARLAADGCTNSEIGAQLFISARTVEWHLRKVFTKLGVSSRTELPALLPGAE